jgi:predicted TIM-barrel fold metal-dependent hydrolase
MNTAESTCAMQPPGMDDARGPYLATADEALLPIVDAHQHFWDLGLRKHPWLVEEPLRPHRYGDYRAVRTTVLPQDYRHAAQPHRIVGSIYVEAEWDASDPLGETRWVHEMHAKTGLPSAMVAQAWLDADDADTLLAEQARCPLVRGVRHKPRAFADPSQWTRGHRLAGSMNCGRFRDGYRRLLQHGLHFELQTPYWHLPDAADLATDFPDTLIVINHTGVLPDRDPATVSRWTQALAEAARPANVRLKISGLGVPGSAWTVEANEPVVRSAIDIFGVDRCMFGSNFPVDGMFRSLSDLFSDFKTITRPYSPADRLKLFHDNAAAVYRLA